MESGMESGSGSGSGSGTREAVKWTEWYCYLLVSTDFKRTYIGATINPDRRLEQHNRLKAGGAKATAGKEWNRFLLIGGFPEGRSALQFEWAWKYNSRKYATRGNSCIQNRLKGLQKLFSQEKSTSTAIPFSEWIVRPHIIDEYSNIDLLKQYVEYCDLIEK
jgi:predicted GIY-YIG superfamily endonuclease